jgi:hypothetical protein
METILILYFVSVTGFIYYFLFPYFDGAELTGSRNWPLLRRAKRLTPPGTIYVLHEDDNSANLAIGNDFLYQLPHFLFTIPFARDILMWLGAVSDRADILNIKAHSVCVIDANVTFFNYAWENSIKIVPIRARRGKLMYSIEMDPKQSFSGDEYMKAYQRLLLL